MPNNALQGTRDEAARPWAFSLATKMRSWPSLQNTERNTLFDARCRDPENDRTESFGFAEEVIVGNIAMQGYAPNSAI
jgi:hypothetical protein